MSDQFSCTEEQLHLLLAALAESQAASMASAMSETDLCKTVAQLLERVAARPAAVPAPVAEEPQDEPRAFAPATIAGYCHGFRLIVSTWTETMRRIYLLKGGEPKWVDGRELPDTHGEGRDFHIGLQAGLTAALEITGDLQHRAELAGRAGFVLPAADGLAS